LACVFNVRNWTALANKSNWACSDIYKKDNITLRHLTFILTLITVASVTACGQTKNTAKEYKRAIYNIKFVFDDYIKYQESSDSQADKNLMTKSLESLNKVTDQKELEILVNVWMYYDPTDFPSRNIVYRILESSRPESIMAVKTRINNKKKWETGDTAPYSELSYLLKQLDK